jgi:hypothetical protein
MGKNQMCIISKDRYLKAAQDFHWATKEHFNLWFTGSRKRHRRTETMLPRLVDKGKLTTFRYGKRLVYAVPRLNKKRITGPEHYRKVEHGLGCTEGLVRIWRSRMEGEIYPERYFYGLQSIPEWAIHYPTNKLLLFEFCTKDNTLRKHVIKGKLTRYRKNLPYIEEKFAEASAIVLFVMAVSRNLVERFVSEVMPAGNPFFFTDYQTFLEIQIGEQLSVPIYIWGEDGISYPLSERK